MPLGIWRGQSPNDDHLFSFGSRCCCCQSPQKTYIHLLNIYYCIHLHPASAPDASPPPGRSSKNAPATEHAEIVQQLEKMEREKLWNTKPHFGAVRQVPASVAVLQVQGLVNGEEAHVLPDHALVDVRLLPCGFMQTTQRDWFARKFRGVTIWKMVTSYAINSVSLGITAGDTFVSPHCR